MIAFDDPVLVAVDYLQGLLPSRPEPYAANVEVGVTKPSAGRSVVLNRDGGPVRLTQDTARLRVRVWADEYQEASLLASLVRTLLLAAPNYGPVVRAESLSGPSDVPDSPQYQFLLSVEWTLRGHDLN